MQLWETNPLRNWTEATIAPANLLDWRERNRVFEDIAWYMGSDTREGGISSYTLNEGQRGGARRGPGRVGATSSACSASSRHSDATSRAEESTARASTASSCSRTASGSAASRASLGRRQHRIRMGPYQYLVAGIMPAGFRFGGAAGGLLGAARVPTRSSTARCAGRTSCAPLPACVPASPSRRPART